MDNEQLIELGKKLQELEDISTVALVLITTLIAFILLWLALKWITNEMDRRE